MKKLFITLFVLVLSGCASRNITTSASDAAWCAGFMYSVGKYEQAEQLVRKAHSLGMSDNVIKAYMQQAQLEQLREKQSLAGMQDPAEALGAGFGLGLKRAHTEKACTL